MKNTILRTLANLLLTLRLRRASIRVAEHLDNYVYYRGRFHWPGRE